MSSAVNADVIWNSQPLRVVLERRGVRQELPQLGVPHVTMRVDDPWNRDQTGSIDEDRSGGCVTWYVGGDLLDRPVVDQDVAARQVADVAVHADNDRVLDQDRSIVASALLLEFSSGCGAGNGPLLALGADVALGHGLHSPVLARGEPQTPFPEIVNGRVRYD